MNHDICERKHGGHECSTEAFSSADRQAVRDAVLDFITACGLEGATADECAVHFSCMHNRTSPRLGELKRDGLIVETKGRRITRTGRPAAVHVAVSVINRSPQLRLF